MEEGRERETEAEEKRREINRRVIAIASGLDALSIYRGSKTTR